MRSDRLAQPVSSGLAATACMPPPVPVLAGRAMPALEATISEDPDPAQPFGLMLEALDALRQDELYVAAGVAPDFALFGELMSIAAMRRGAAGADAMAMCVTRQRSSSWDSPCIVGKLWSGPALPGDCSRLSNCRGHWRRSHQPGRHDRGRRRCTDCDSSERRTRSFHQGPLQRKTGKQCEGGAGARRLGERCVPAFRVVVTPPDSKRSRFRSGYGPTSLT